MRKKIALLGILALALALPMTSYSYSVNYDNGTQYTTTALTGFSTYGDMMDGMSITAYFIGGGSQTVAWADTGAGSGGVTGTRWSLNLSGDTFGANWNLNSDVQLSRLVLDGVPGDTIFDITSPVTATDPYGYGTPDSARGWTFQTAYTGDLTATYRNLLGVGGNDPVGDLYTMLDLSFGSNGFSGALSFIADTDNAASAGDINPVPEPASMLLLGLGLMGMAGARRYLKK